MSEEEKTHPERKYSVTFVMKVRTKTVSNKKLSKENVKFFDYLGRFRSSMLLKLRNKYEKIVVIEVYEQTT